MELNSKGVLAALKAKGIQTLHHANTVQTACLFLRNGRILSRGTVEEQGLKQTFQKSDEMDKKFGIWYDVFLDSVDIHERAGSRNLYGPVLLRFELDLLAEDWLPAIWVTKKNPTKWKEGEPASDRYFSSVAEFAEGYTKGDFGSMFMLRQAGGILRLTSHLRDIVLDDPKGEYEGLDVYSHTVGALRASAWQGGIEDVEIVKRECTAECKCAGQYGGAPQSEGKKLFFFTSASL